LFIFSLILSVSASSDNNGRKKFDTWLRDTLQAHLRLPLPFDSLFHDYAIDDGGNFDEAAEDEEEKGVVVKPVRSKNWMADLLELTLSSVVKSDIIVPTIENVRNAFLVEFLLKNDKTVLCMGPTGTGKTQTIIDALHTLDGDLV